MRIIIFISLLVLIATYCSKNEPGTPPEACIGCGDNAWTQECETIEPPQAKDRIVYISYDRNDYEIITMNPDGKEQRILTDNNYHDSQPKWSWDARRIIFTSDRTGNFDLWVMFSDGRCQKRITDTPEDELDPSFSPDGRMIAFVSYPENELSEIYTMDLETGEIKRLTYDPGVDGKPAWSPDGKKIAFVSNRSGKFEIYTMNAGDGSDQQPIPGTKIVQGKTYNVTEGVLGGPAWSPDGSQIAFSDSFVEWDIYLRPGIVIINKDGTGYRALTPDDDATTYRDSEPSWSPDGKYIVYMSSKSGLGELYRVNVENGEIVRLTENTTADGSPSWSPVQ